MKVPTAKQAKINAARRIALAAALNGKTEGNSTSLAASYGLPVSEVKAAMLSKGVMDR